MRHLATFTYVYVRDAAEAIVRAAEGRGGWGAPSKGDADNAADGVVEQRPMRWTSEGAVPSARGAGWAGADHESYLIGEGRMQARPFSSSAAAFADTGAEP